MSNETLRETLLFQPKHGYDRLTPAQKAEMESYCKDYAAFIPPSRRWTPTLSLLKRPASSARDTWLSWMRPKPSGRL